MAGHYRYAVYSWDECVYVGYTKDPTATLEYHQQFSYWWDESYEIVLIRYATEREAFESSQLDIAVNEPKYNMSGAQCPPA